MCSLLQVIQLPIPFTGGRLYYGTGIISVIGISFVFLPIAQGAIATMIVRCRKAHQREPRLVS